MQRQLDHILSLAGLTNIIIQVLPYGAGAHPGLDSPFSILRFTDSLLSDVVYVEGLVGHLYLERKADVERYKQAFVHLSKIALDSKSSADLIAEVARNGQ